MSTKRDLRTGEMGRELSLGVNRLGDVDYNSLLSGPQEHLGALISH
jgi:hypothetical protein